MAIRTLVRTIINIRMTMYRLNQYPHKIRQSRRTLLVPIRNVSI